jgi:hypothetical protein
MDNWLSHAQFDDKNNKGGSKQVTKILWLKTKVINFFGEQFLSLAKFILNEWLFCPSLKTSFS